MFEPGGDGPDVRLTPHSQPVRPIGTVPQSRKSGLHPLSKTGVSDSSTITQLTPCSTPRSGATSSGVNLGLAPWPLPAALVVISAERMPPRNPKSSAGPVHVGSPGCR